LQKKEKARSIWIGLFVDYPAEGGRSSLENLPSAGMVKNAPHLTIQTKILLLTSLG
jgi:hypothetical protein